MNSQSTNSSSVIFSDSLMSADDALSFLIDSACVTASTEAVSLDDSLGRILASDIHQQ